MEEYETPQYKVSSDVAELLHAIIENAKKRGKELVDRTEDMLQSSLDSLKKYREKLGSYGEQLENQLMSAVESIQKYKEESDICNTLRQSIKASREYRQKNSMENVLMQKLGIQSEEEEVKEPNYEVKSPFIEQTRAQLDELIKIIKPKSPKEVQEQFSAFVDELRKY